MTTSDAALRELIEGAQRERHERSRNTMVTIAILMTILGSLVLLRDPTAWWGPLLGAAFWLLPLLARGRTDGAIRSALLERPEDVVEITHHRGKPTMRAGGLRGAVAAGMRNASHDQFYVWIVTRDRKRGALLFDATSGPRALDVLGARCPHVTVRRGLPSGFEGMVVD